MSEAAQQSDAPAPQISFSLRVLFFFGNPLIAVGLLGAAVLAAIVGTVAGKLALIFGGIALAISAIGVFLLVGLIALDSLNGRAAEILSGITSLHSEELQKLAAAQQRPAPEPFSFRFKN
jgi:hypothetical protein